MKWIVVESGKWKAVCACAASWRSISLSESSDVDAGEEALVGRAIVGDRDALAALLKRFGPVLEERLRREIDVRWQSLIDPEDVLQVTFLECFLKIGVFQNQAPGSFESWLTRICRNNLLDAIRSLQRASEFPQQQRVTLQNEMDSSWALAELLGATTGTPSRYAAVEEMHTRVRQAVAQLPRDYGQVLTLYDLEARPVDEVATMMRRSKGAVYMLRARALDYLREMIGGESKI
jgi:RNA polymerase sigma-70 factor (ECF subfamily)